MTEIAHHAASENVIELKQVSFSREEKVIFEGLNLHVRKGQIVAVMGPSGTGKTTLLNMITGQLAPQAGQVLVNDQHISRLSQSALYRLRRHIGVLFQEGGLFTDLNVYDNVAFPLRQHTHLSEVMIRDLVLSLLQAVGLRGARRLRVEQLSGGMARRVALARSVVLGPQIMLYDEPFTGQDPIGRGVLVKLIKEMNQALGMTSVLVSHDVPETALIADYVYILHEGRIVGEGVPSTLFEQNLPAVNQFIRGLPDGPVSFHYPAPAFMEDLQG